MGVCHPAPVNRHMGFLQTSGMSEPQVASYVLRSLSSSAIPSRILIILGIHFRSFNSLCSPQHLIPVYLSSLLRGRWECWSHRGPQVPGARDSDNRAGFSGSTSVLPTLLPWSWPSRWVGAEFGIRVHLPRVASFSLLPSTP